MAAAIAALTASMPPSDRKNEPHPSARVLPNSPQDQLANAAEAAPFVVDEYQSQRYKTGPNMMNNNNQSNSSIGLRSSATRFQQSNAAL